MTHEPRLMRELRTLIQSRRVAALGTLDAAQSAQPFVSMVPYAVWPQAAALVVHLSGLAAHTRNLQTHPQASLLVMAGEVAHEPVHALQRVTLDVVAETPKRDSDTWRAARGVYLARFPEAEPMTELGDFRFVLLRPAGARQVAGFGAARSVDADEIRRVLTA
jgi:putative heme iron utilization protein